MPPRLVLQTGHFASVNAVAWSPDGAMLATAGEDWGVKLWQSASAAVVQTLRGHGTYVTQVAFAPNGQLLASADTDGVVVLWDPRSGAVTATVVDPDRLLVSSLVFSADGALLAVAVGLGGDFPAKIRLWDVATRTLLRSIDEGSEGIAQLLLAPDGATLWSAGKDRKIRNWDARSGALNIEWQAHQEEVTSLALTPNGELLASGSSDGVVKVWRTGDRTLLHEIASTAGERIELDFSPAGDALVVGGPEPRIFDARTGTVRTKLEPRAELVRGLRFSPKGDGVCGIGTGGEGRSVHGDVLLWEAASGRWLRALSGHHGVGLSAIVRHPSRPELVSANSSGQVVFWSLESGAKLRSIDLPFAVQSLALSPDGQLLAAAGGTLSSGAVSILDVATRQVRAQLGGHPRLVRAAAFSADGRRLASASEDGALRIWSVATWQQEREIAGASVALFSTVFSSDGSLVFAGGHDGTVKAFDAATGELRKTLKNQSSRVFALALSADGKRLASGGVNTAMVTVWNLDTGTIALAIQDVRLAPWALAFAGDSGLVVANANGRVLMLDLVEKKVGRTLVVHDLAASALAVVPHTQRLWTAGHDYAMCLVDFQREQALATLYDVSPNLVGPSQQLKAGEFLAIDPEGFYLATAGAERSLRFRRAGMLAAVLAFRKHYRSPKRVAKALRAG